MRRFNSGSVAGRTMARAMSWGSLPRTMKPSMPFSTSVVAPPSCVPIEGQAGGQGFALDAGEALFLGGEHERGAGAEEGRQLGVGEACAMGVGPFPFGAFAAEIAFVIADADQFRLRQALFDDAERAEEVLVSFAQADGADIDEPGLGGGSRAFGKPRHRPRTG